MTEYSREYNKIIDTQLVSSLRQTQMLKNSTDILNKCLANLTDRRKETATISSSELKIDINDLKLDENTINLLLHFIYDDRYIPIAKTHGLSSKGSIISIQLSKYFAFEITELYTVAENHQIKNGEFLLLPPVSYQNTANRPSMLPLEESLIRSFKKADEKVNLLSQTIEQLEAKIKLLTESEKVHEEALLLEMGKDKASIIELNLLTDASSGLVEGISVEDLEDHLN